MPTDSTHPDYDANLNAWLRARDVFAGEDAVKAANERYLPKLDSQTADEYLAYKARASFFNATAHTVDGFVGLIFRREPTVKLPERVSGVAGALRVFAEDVDLLGTSLYTFSKNIVGEVLTVGRAGTLVDWEGGSATGHYGEQRGYVVRYTAEQIRNWQVSRINGRNLVTLVVLAETVTTDHGPQTTDVDEFEREEVDQLRVLRLVNARPHPGPLPRGEGASTPRSHERSHMYVVEIWRQKRNGTKRSNKTEWVKVETRIPLRLGKPLTMIPFVFHRPRHSLPAANPFITAKDAAEQLEVAFTTAQRAIERLERLKIVKQVDDAKRGRVYCANALLDILEEPAQLRPVKA